jgi:hypothetical protein
VILAATSIAPYFTRFVRTKAAPADERLLVAKTGALAAAETELDEVPALTAGQSETWALIGSRVGQRSLSVTADVYTHVLLDDRELDHANLVAEINARQ